MADGAGLATPTHLVAFGTASERALLAGMLPTTRDVWIGLSERKEEGVFRWVTAEANPFINGQPPWKRDNPADNDEECVGVSAGWELEDKNCNEVMASICECDMNGSVPENYAQLRSPGSPSARSTDR